MSKNKKLFEDLQKFFIQVNKVRTDVMKKENPYDSYEYFSKDENPELIIRRGMNQYEDLVKKFKQFGKKERKLSKGSENTTPIKPNTINEKEKKEIIGKKIEFNNGKVNENKNEEKKIVEQVKKEEKIEKKKEIILEDFVKEPEEGYEHSQIESADYDISPEIKITAKWYYINKKKIENNEGNLIGNESKEEEEEEKVKIRITATSNKILILHWGIYKSNQCLNWIKPPVESYPPDTIEIDKMSVETEFPEKGERSIQFILSRGKGYKDYIGGVSFVIYDPINKIWYNNYRKDYQIKFKIKIDKTASKMILMKSGLYVPDFVLDIIDCEANYGSWTLMHRYNKCSEIVQNWGINTDNKEKSDIQNSEKWIWIYIWLRYSFLRELDWQRNYNTRPALLSGAMSNLSDILTRKYSEFIKSENNYRNLIQCKSFIIKNILSLLGKGTGNGQEIRDEILKIMRRNKMSKKPEKNFYEQWHQKLHNNTTPDDIVICEAVINFLKSKGDKNVYWKTLKEGGVSKERLASYERNITDEPFYSPDYNVNDFENYLKILKSVHSSTDLYMTYEGCKNYIGNNAIEKMEDILKNKDTTEIIPQLNKVAELREELSKIINNLISQSDNMKLREVLFLEISLEIYVRQLIEKMIHIQLDYKTYIQEISILLRHIKISFPFFSEFNLCFDDWNNIVMPLSEKDSTESALKIKSVLSRLSRILTSVIDYYNKYYDAKGKYFGKECNCDNFVVQNFSEELIRGSIFFALSMLLKKIEPIIRQKANLGDWLIISRGIKNKIFGKLIFVKKLHEVQFTKYSEPTIIISENISGDEEIPINCVCLVIIKSENYPDVLSHVSVRARNLNTPFAVCFNEKKSDGLIKLLWQNVEVNINNQEFIFSKNINNKNNNKNEEENNDINKKISIEDIGTKYKKIFLELEEFEKNCVGAKSLNTKNILKEVPNCEWLKYPESFAVPFNVNEYFLSLKENKEIKEEIDEYISKIKLARKPDIIKDLLEKCKSLTLKINFVENEETLKLKNKLISFGIKQDEFNSAFNSIKSVWASKFNERVYIATNKVGINISQIKMSVLIQKIIPAEYAYVIHTKNPTNNSKQEIFAEIVCGMGEALVGAYEGQSFSFIYNKENKKYEIKSYPNKSIALKNEGFIFRSDSNMEDLEGFSGAGLFDSVPIIENKEVEMSYSNDKLFKDKAFVENMINKIAMIGIGIEKMYGFEQDIEGVYYNGEFYVVQTRPQV